MWLGPIHRQLTRGVTPRALALSLAVGLGLGTFPVLGATAILCAAAAAALRLNHPAIQLVNVVAYPLQLLLLVPLLRAGGALFGAPAEALTLDALLLRIGTDPWGAARLYGQAVAGAVIVWTLVAVPSVLLLSRAFRWALERVPILRESRPEPVRGHP